MVEATEDKSKWEYVTIPEQDIFDRPFPTIRINLDEFGAGRTFFVPPILANELKTIITRRQREDVKILQPRKNQAALDQLEANSALVRSNRFEVERV